ncbi:hypothetical protein AVEN_258918-1 [Araneus ventricosus]|uniref:Uncharacterized protein n=1 Tax=Araneus ventricosus TaxID=182803 RepID=A0A4Y2CF80_ARAVE|nr:hypothetical protein AVEN_258918-1 [Araneus ventricosus]
MRSSYSLPVTLSGVKSSESASLENDQYLITCHRRGETSDTGMTSCQTHYAGSCFPEGTTIVVRLVKTVPSPMTGGSLSNPTYSTGYGRSGAAGVSIPPWVGKGMRTAARNRAI